MITCCSVFRTGPIHYTLVFEPNPFPTNPFPTFEPQNPRIGEFYVPQDRRIIKVRNCERARRVGNMFILLYTLLRFMSLMITQYPRDQTFHTFKTSNSVERHIL